MATYLTQGRIFNQVFCFMKVFGLFSIIFLGWFYPAIGREPALNASKQNYN